MPGAPPYQCEHVTKLLLSKADIGMWSCEESTQCPSSFSCVDTAECASF